ncbi:hypothetical protein PJK54_01570 [Cobetia sp. MMG027]|uniref:hypothetical protein n=1 Tax=Cobetia sp. MMG027 TaxID=3021980 RepID=UPI0022FF3AF8|nr:hypothetical protein [Cobetia sp. MMG027]MDA5562357.1 hypothetical protein [Cobetia sp. MMG027]
MPDATYTPSLVKISADKTLVIYQRVLEVDTAELMNEEHAFRPTVATESLPLAPVRFCSNVQSTHTSEEFVNFHVIQAIVSTQKVPVSQSVFCIEIDIGRLNEDEVQVVRFYYQVLQPLLELGWEWINIHNLHTTGDIKINEKKLWNHILINFISDERLQYAWSNVVTQRNLPITRKQISSMFRHRYSVDSIRKFMNEINKNTNTHQSGVSKDRNTVHAATAAETNNKNTNTHQSGVSKDRNTVHAATAAETNNKNAHSKRKDNRKQQPDINKKSNAKEKSKHSNNKEETDSNPQMGLALSSSPY